MKKGLRRLGRRWHRRLLTLQVSRTLVGMVLRPQEPRVRGQPGSQNAPSAVVPKVVAIKSIVTSESKSDTTHLQEAVNADR